jgi:hypothetical protein
MSSPVIVATLASVNAILYTYLAALAARAF